MTKEELIENLLAIGFYKATRDNVRTKHNPYGNSTSKFFESFYQGAYFYDFSDGCYFVFDFYTGDNGGHPALFLYSGADCSLNSVFFRNGYDEIWEYLND